MDYKPLFGTNGQIVWLGNKLSKLNELAKATKCQDPDCQVLAYHISELEAIFAKFLAEYVPALANKEMNAEELKDFLIEIGIELNEVLYHMNEAPFLNTYLYYEDREQ
ncbi:MAG: hypothetical protein A2Y10_01305 [Planctomycetes bacterium GWF2_41_51]|nr:MAG: hypothetical protein A2Y10_01305 [Planctomycetes bacterium GWF2_41_51]HBG26735.1 hypothetical protein [Phycisphaerales bacterium]